MHSYYYFLLGMPVLPASKNFCWTLLNKWESYTEIPEENANLLKIY